MSTLSDFSVSIYGVTWYEFRTLNHCLYDTWQIWLYIEVNIIEINLHLPRNSDSLPTIQLFYMVTMGECMLCFVATLAMVRLLDRGSDNTLPFYVPIWVRRHVFRMKEHEIAPSCQQRRKQQGSGGAYHLLQITDQHQAKATREKKLSNATMSLPGKFPMHFIEADGRSFSSRNDNSIEKRAPLHMVQNAVNPCPPPSSQKLGRMTWGILVKQIDKLCLRIVLLLFVFTSVAILLPAYLVRKEATKVHSPSCLTKETCQ